MAGTGKALCSAAGAVLCSGAGAVLYDGVAATRIGTLSYVAFDGAGSYVNYYSPWQTIYYWNNNAAGYSGYLTLRLTNSGNSTLTVTSIGLLGIFNGATMSADWTSGSIAPGGHQDIRFSFSVPAWPPQAGISPYYTPYCIDYASNATSKSGLFGISAINYSTGCD